MTAVKGYLISILFFSYTVSALSVPYIDSEPCCSLYRHMPPGYTVPGTMLCNILQDMVAINLNIISFSTFKIVVVTFPLVIAGRMIDERLQSCFYDRQHHKNINQMDDACRLFAKHSIVYPCFLAGALSVAAHDEDVKETSRMFLKGLPFVMIMSDLIKKFDVCLVGKGCLRPWNEHFSRIKRARGGFPSGHLASISYATTLYGVRFGPKWGIPLSILTAAVGMSFLNCNRHYLSQIIAGIGLGAIYGCAASKQVDFRLCKKYNASAHFDVDKCGSPSVNLRVNF